jgi:hypothetical protein
MRLSVVLSNSLHYVRQSSIALPRACSLIVAVGLVARPADCAVSRVEPSSGHPSSRPTHRARLHHCTVRLRPQRHASTHPWCP